MLSDTELNRIEAEVKAMDCRISGGYGGFPPELLEQCATEEQIAMGLKAAEEAEQLNAGAQPKPRPAGRIAATWQPIIAKINARAA